ncbi:hypothetical protein PT974_04975 [Cladobotryum mycophilum]|uniref:Uncharacterized protein n=1 Tax=Cladobotryum mycophilum TaxID=491253 RepID=A0ABR0SQQ1_9HYPO
MRIQSLISMVLAFACIGSAAPTPGDTGNPVGNDPQPGNPIGNPVGHGRVTIV